MRRLSAYCFCIFTVAAAAAQTISTIAGTDWIFPATPLPALQAPLGYMIPVAADAIGNYYVADSSNYRVFKVDISGSLTLVAGNGLPGYKGDGGPATAASLSFEPQGLAVDNAGDLYIADTNNYVVRMVNAAGIITTVAGNGTQGFSGDGGPATSAQLSFPTGIALDSGGTLYISDTINNRVRMVKSGTITTVAGTGLPGFAGDGGPSANAWLNAPWGLAVDKQGDLLIADYNNARIRMVTTVHFISTVAGNGFSGFSGDGGPATSASISALFVACDTSGNFYINDSSNRVRQINAARIISTFAGNGTVGYSGDGGPATSAALAAPVGVAVDVTGTVLIVDGNNHRVRKVAPNGTITTAAGNGDYRYSGDGGPAASAELNVPTSLTADHSGNYFMADSANMRIRQVNSSGTITTVAGNGILSFSGDGGPATSASLASPQGVTLDSSGDLIIADSGNQRVRKVDTSGTITTMAGTGAAGYAGDNGPASGATLWNPSAVALDSAGNLYIADTYNNVLRMVNTAGTITTVAGNHVYGYSGDSGPATSASLAFPGGVAVDAKGNLLIADTNNHRIRMVSPAGTITTVAGNGVQGYTGDGGAATSAALFYPDELVLDGAGNLYIADSGNNTVRMVNPAGIITTVAGGTSGFSGDGGPATSAAMNNPYGVTLDSAGNVLIADTYNYRIRQVPPCVQSVIPSPIYLDATAQFVPPLTVTTAGTTCSWSAVASAPFINITAGATGSGNGKIKFSVLANVTGAPLTGTISVNSVPVPVTQRETATVFTDVPPSSVFFDFIDTLYARGITGGCSTNPLDYCPDAPTTRGEMAVFIITGIEGSSNFTYTTTPYFTDVPPTDPFFKFVQKMKDLGITSGCTPTTYCPDNPVTRAQMAVFVIVARYGTIPFTYPSTPYFTDVPSSSVYFPFVQKMAQVGITSGCGGGLYCPDDSSTRGQMAVFIDTGLLNQLLPAGTPVIATVSPNVGVQGQNVAVTLFAVNTHFVQGTTQVALASGLTASNITVNSATSLTMQIAVSSGALQGPSTIVVTTGAEEAVLPNGFTVQ